MTGALVAFAPCATGAAALLAAALAPLPFVRRKLRRPCPPPAQRSSTTKRRFAPPCSMRWSTSPPASHPPVPKRRRPVSIAAIPLAAALLLAPAAAVPDARPACGGASIRRAPLLGRLGEAGATAAGGSARTRKPGVENLECRGRTAEFAHADREQGSMPAQIKHYRKRRISIPGLPTGRRTTMARRAGARRPLPGSSAAKRGLIGCPANRGAGTPGTPVRRTDYERGARCAFTELGME